MSNVRIGRLGDEHFQESMKLAQFAFQYTRTEQQLEEIRVRIEEEPSERWGMFVDGQLAAQATVLELAAYIGGKVFPMGGVAAVSTWPEHRRQGYVAKLLVHLLERMRERGQIVSFLSPFAFAFYRKYGWETYTEHKTYTIQTRQLPVRKPYNGRFERLNDYNDLQALYETYASKFNGTLSRSELWWKHRIPMRKPGQIALYRDSQGEAQGYLIYEVKEYQLTVHEFVYLTSEAYEAIWSFIAQHDSMIEKVTLTVPMNDRLTDMIADPRIKQEIVPYFMARIVDVEAFLGAYPFLASDSADRVCLDITDEHAPWNNGCFELVIAESGQAEAKRLTGERPAEETVKIGIGTLTSMLLTYRSVSDLSFLNRIEGDSEVINRLQNRIPERMTYLPDFF